VTEGLASGGPAQGAAGDPVVDAWRGLLVAHSRLVPAVEADLRAAGQVPLSWYDVLLELNAAPDRRLRMSELGQRTVLSRTRVSRVVDELAAAGLAERQPDQADGRSSFAVLTPGGQEALRRAWPVYRQAIHRQLTSRLTLQQCCELAALLGQVIATADIDPPVTIRASRLCADPGLVRRPRRPRPYPGRRRRTWSPAGSGRSCGAARAGRWRASGRRWRRWDGRARCRIR
jgi:DNA-binding MarR family transcriptional regulator